MLPETAWSLTAAPASPGDVHRGRFRGGSMVSPALTGRPPGWLAAGHPSETAQGIEMMHGQQALTPRPAASLATVWGNEGPIGSSIQQHQGRAQVQVLDQVAAANPTLAGQLGPRAPGGIAPQPPAHIAPTGAEVRDRPIVPPAMFYDGTPGILLGGSR